MLIPTWLQASENNDLYAMDFEQLMEVEVISIAKKPQSIRRTAAAIHVISQADIQRSGATSLPDVLRGVPGLHVAQVDANKWAISIRGFNSRLANKLLVLVDGRSVYTPIFAGVYWNMQDMMLEDIERIEVVRGGGGALWGANAVNGVINIITQHAKETQGTQLSILGGSQEQIGSARFGGKISEETHYRVFAKGRRVDNNENSLTETANDRWENIHAGFRVDNNSNENSQWLLEGAYTNGNADQTIATLSFTPPSVIINKANIDYQSGHLLARWNHQLAQDNNLQVQGYYDYFERSSIEANLLIHTFDLDMQHQFKWLDNHTFVWGLGYRSVYDEIYSSFTSSFTPKSRYAGTFSGFIQDEIQLHEDVQLTLGSKFEHNDYTGLEFQPSARLAWQVNSEHSIWTAFSRSVRTPSRSHEDIRVNFLALPGRGRRQPAMLFSIFGNPDIESEKVYSAELGYRALLTPKVSIDTAVFYNYYDDLASLEQSGSFETQPIPHLLVAFTQDNQMIASSYGAEIQAKWQVHENWQLAASYSWLKIDAQLRAGSTDTIDSVVRIETSDPQHQASLRSIFQLPFDLELDASVYYTDAIARHQVDNYTRVDLRLAWKPSDLFEISLIGQNLLDSQHKEYTSSEAFYTEVPRSVYAKVVTRF